MLRLAGEKPPGRPRKLRKLHSRTMTHAERNAGVDPGTPHVLTRTLLKYIFRVGLVLIALPLAYVLLAFILGSIPVNRDAQQAQHGIEVFVGSNGVHTDFVMPVRSEAIDWQAHFPVAHFRNVEPSVSHIAFGWGDREFYLETPTWADLELGTAFRASLLTSRSAMHVTYLNHPGVSERRKRIVLSSAQYQHLVGYVLDSFERDTSNRVILIPDKGYGSNDAFYTANGSYSLWNTCNTWTGRGLRQIGIKTGVWTPFAGSVLLHL